MEDVGVRFRGGDDGLAGRIGQVADDDGQVRLHHRQERGRFHRAVFDRAEHRGFLIGEGRPRQDLVAQHIDLRGRIVPGGDGHRHQVLSPTAQADAVTEGVMAVTAGEHIQAGGAGAGTETFHGRFPVHAKGAVAVFFAHHYLGTIDKGAADDGMDRFSAETGALAQHIVADGRKGRPIDHALIDILPERLQLPVDLLAEGRIGHQTLEIRGNFLEGRLRIGPMV